MTFSESFSVVICPRHSQETATSHSPSAPFPLRSAEHTHGVPCQLIQSPHLGQLQGHGCALPAPWVRALCVDRTTQNQRPQPTRELTSRKPRLLSGPSFCPSVKWEVWVGFAQDARDPCILWALDSAFLELAEPQGTGHGPARPPLLVTFVVGSLAGAGLGGGGAVAAVMTGGHHCVQH